MDIVHPLYSSYVISDKGFVRSKLSGKILKPYNGQVSLKLGDNFVTVWVDELVADCFLGDRPANSVIYHKDKDRCNAKLDNICYMTEENLKQLQHSCDWFDIPGYEGYYQITRTGKVRALDRIITSKRSNIVSNVMQYGRELSPYKGNDDYMHVGLSINGKNKLHSIHQLVAKVFIPNPYNYCQVNHIDGNKCNNTVTNLEWVSQIQNMNHAYRTGLWSPKKCGQASAIACGTRIRCIETGEEFLSISSAAKKHNMDYNSVKESADLKRARKGLHFEYM